MRSGILFFAGCLYFFVVCCKGRRNAWGDTLSKQMNAAGSVKQIDSVVVDFMIKYDIPGMSVAISKDKRQVYAKGYGFANRSGETEVSNESLFPVGRASAPITAIAIMKLVKDGKLSLDARVFGDSGILRNDFGTLPYGPHITNISINDLLHHTCGGWSDNDDPIWNLKYRDHPFTQTQLLSLGLDNIQLRSVPGNTFAYSDFGYFILGRVVEKISGRSYGNFVNETILRPNGIYDMQIEGDDPDHKQKNEVTLYKDQGISIFKSGEEDESYSYTARADACIGWIASATDLLRLIDMVDGTPAKPGILDTSTIRTMLSGSKANPHYACGWYLNQDFTNWGYQSSLYGSTSEIARTAGGYSWVILIDTYRPVMDSFMTDMDQLVWKVINDPATNWTPVKKN